MQLFHPIWVCGLYAFYIVLNSLRLSCSGLIFMFCCNFFTPLSSTVCIAGSILYLISCLLSLMRVFLLCSIIALCFNFIWCSGCSFLPHLSGHSNSSNLYCLVVCECSACCLKPGLQYFHFLFPDVLLVMYLSVKS